MKSHIALFRFTLLSGQSIGPTSLRQLWSRACGTTDVDVGRQSLPGGRYTYSLYASQQLTNLAAVERRLRLLLENARLSASLSALHAA